MVNGQAKIQPSSTLGHARSSAFSRHGRHEPGALHQPVPRC